MSLPFPQALEECLPFYFVLFVFTTIAGLFGKQQASIAKVGPKQYDYQSASVGLPSIIFGHGVSYREEKIRAH